MIRASAYAKINLTLEVLGRHPDGYHEIRSVAQTLRLHDTLTFDRAERWEIHVLGAAVEPELNLVTRAGSALERALGRHLPSRVTCEKRIPLAAGLGGGSSDAAATLLGLRRLWGLPLSDPSLSAIGAALGSDVPFLLRGGTALLQGRGEIVLPTDPLPRCWVLLAVPPGQMPAKTATMYGQLRPEHFTQGERSEALLQALTGGPERVNPLRWNAFESIAQQVFPGLADLQRRLGAASGLEFRLSGAGPALYALLPTADEARRALRRLRPLDVPLILTSTVQSGPRLRGKARLAPVQFAAAVSKLS